MLDPEGEPIRLTSDKQDIKGFTWDADEKSVIASMKRGQLTRSLWRIPLNGGAPEHLPEAGIEPLTPSISPKTAQLAYMNVIEDTNIWRAGNDQAPLIQSNRGDSSPQISPDNNWIVFRSSRSGSAGIWLAHRDGTGARMLSDCGGTVCGSARWAPDGRRIAYDSRQAGSADIYIMPIDGGKAVRFRDLLYRLQSGDGGRARADRVLRVCDPRAQAGGQDLADARYVGLSLGVSPDGSELFYTQLDRMATDLYLIDGFR